MSQSIKRPPGVRQSLQRGSDGISGKQRPSFRRAQALGKPLGRGVEPDREALIGQRLANLFVADAPATGGENGLPSADQTQNRLPLPFPETRFAETGKNRLDSKSRRTLDFLVAVDEGQVQPLREAAPDLGLAHPRRANENNRSFDRFSPEVDEAGAIQIERCWGKRPAMVRPRYDFGSQRRRRSPLAMIAILLLILVVGLLVYASTVDTEVPVGPMSQDVTNEVLAE